MPFGLTNAQIKVVRSVFKRFPEIKKVMILGSRAMGNFKKGSDVDLAIMGNVKTEIVAEISMILNEETTLPYLFDVIHYESISNEELKRHVDEYGTVFYEGG